MYRKTIALLVPRLYNGGAEKVAANMSIFLSDAGYRVLFFLDVFDRQKCYCHKGKEIVIEADSVIEKTCQVKQLYRYIKRAQKYRQYKKKYKVDISISFMVEENLTNILSDVGEKKILTMHSVTSLVEEFRGLIFVNPFLMRTLYPKADAVVAVSEAVKRDLECRINLRRGITEVIYNPIDICRLQQLAKEPIDQKLGENTILYVGRLDHDKRPWIAVRIMQDVIQKVGDARLIMFGQGENKGLLKKLIKNLHLETHVTMAGFEDNVAKYMARAKALVLCSETESFSCALAEALALGLPSVVCDCPGGVREVISSNQKRIQGECKDNVVVECGIVTPMVFVDRQDSGKPGLSREEKMMAKAVCSLLEDTELWNRLHQNAFNRAPKFSQEQIAQEWLTLLEQ